MTQFSLASLPTMLVAALAGMAAACAPPAPGDVLLGQLEAKQFLKYAGPNADKVRAEIKDKGWPALFGDSGRVFGADGLTLAKGGVSKFIERLRPFLEGQGVKIPELKDDLQQESYTLLVDGAPFPIWTKEDLTRELGAQPGITSGLAAARAFALVNKLLENAKSPERAYAIYSGAALSVMFLTDDLLAVMKADPVAVPKFMPYQLTTDFPFFGQPRQ
ncbi:MAG TPA: hypothetical protein PKU70_14075 [Vicinamibacteria bacterium]|nr:hypothetical protein [Vicinamibacteria bacterium]